MSDPRPLALIICGGRDYSDAMTLRKALDKLASRRLIEYVTAGRATGADKLGEEWANDRGITVCPVPAPWNRLGKSAGSRRNAAMLGMLAAYCDALGVDPMVVAFPGGRGTANMVRIAEDAGIKVWNLLGL